MPILLKLFPKTEEDGTLQTEGIEGNYINFPGGASDKELGCQYRRHKRCGFNPYVRKISWRRAWQPTPVFLSGEFHGQKSLMGYGP